MNLANIKILHLRGHPTLGELAATIQDRVARLPSSMRTPLRRILVTFVAELMLHDADKRNWDELTGETT